MQWRHCSVCSAAQSSLCCVLGCMWNHVECHGMIRASLRVSHLRPVKEVVWREACMKGSKCSVKQWNARPGSESQPLMESRLFAALLKPPSQIGKTNLALFSLQFGIILQFLEGKASYFVSWKRFGGLMEGHGRASIFPGDARLAQPGSFDHFCPLYRGQLNRCITVGFQLLNCPLDGPSGVILWGVWRFFSSSQDEEEHGRC